MDFAIMEDLGAELFALAVVALIILVLGLVENRRKKRRERKPEKTWIASTIPMPMPGMAKIDFYDGCLCNIIGDLKVVEFERKKEIHE